ncbi:MAG: NADH-quinone oxidoreductase subunit H [Candidatus Omnitrophota bacterium]
MDISAIIRFLLVIILSPFLLGVVNRTKAFFAGRQGAPLLQSYYDIVKLLHKGAVYSRTTTWLFVAGPIVGISAVVAAGLLMPFAGRPAFLSFDGDLVLFVYLLGLTRFFTVLAALDTGSSFTGMGASREVQFALFAEPALFLSLAALARETGQLSLSGIFSALTINSWRTSGPVLALIAAALLIVFLAENARIPVDDPNTHLELTMIHEVMVLDHGGVELAYIFSCAALKFWLLGSLLVGVVFPLRSALWGVDFLLFFLGMILLAMSIGVIESVFARLRLIKVPHFLVAGLSLAILALIFQMKS